MTPFCFEHVFIAASPAEVFAAYFDPALQLELDRELAISERDLLEFVDRRDELHRVCRVVPKRQLPALLRPFSSGPLHYLETVTGYRRRNEIEISLRLFGDRGRVAASYRLVQRGPGSIDRRYAGEVSVDVALVASRIERGIVAEFERSLALGATCTQNWLDRQSQRSVAART